MFIAERISPLDFLASSLSAAGFALIPSLTAICLSNLLILGLLTLLIFKTSHFVLSDAIRFE